ncbi:MAG: ABC transporter ATP-binding protein [Burkholderiaceae bacterium]
MTEGTPALRLAGVGKRFTTSRELLRDVSLTLARGERVALLGESGTGKSTLLNLVAGLEPPDAGEIFVDGVAMHALGADAAAAVRRRSIGFVFQAFHLIPHLSVERNVAVPLLLNGVAPGDALGRARGMLARVGLGERGASAPGELSGGEQQRVALARALVHRPVLLLADEPTGNLDPGSAAVALALLDEQVRAHDAALLIVTHSEQAAAIADRRLRLGADGLRPA